MIGKINAVIAQLFGGNVNGSGASNGQALVYTSSTGTWAAGTISSSNSLGQVVNVGNIVNSVSASAGITWTMGGTYSSSAPHIQGSTDTNLFFSTQAAAGGNGLHFELNTASATANSNIGGRFDLLTGTGLTSGGSSTSGASLTINGGQTTGGGDITIVSGNGLVTGALPAGQINLSCGHPFSTSGTIIGINATNTSVADSGVNSSTVYQHFFAQANINYTGATKTGHYEMLVVSAKETSLPTGTNYLFRLLAGSAGTTSIYNIDNTGHIYINCTAASGAYSVASSQLLNASSTAASVYNFYTASGTQSDQSYLVLARSEGTPTSPTSLSSGDALGEILWSGNQSGSGNGIQGAFINATAAEAWSAASHSGAYMSFGTATIAGGSPVERWRITDAGHWVASASLVVGWASGSTSSSPQTGISQLAAASIAFGNGTANDVTGTLNFSAAVMGGKVTKYANVSTAGWGVPAIYSSGRNAAVAAAASTPINAFAVPAADTTYEVSANVLVTTLGSGSFTVTATYTDEGNTSRTLTLPFYVVAGTSATTINTAAPYMGLPMRIRCKASTTVTVASVAGTFTGCTYNIEATLKQIS